MVAISLILGSSRREGSSGLALEQRDGEINTLYHCHSRQPATLALILPDSWVVGQTPRPKLGHDLPADPLQKNIHPSLAPRNINLPGSPEAPGKACSQHRSILSDNQSFPLVIYLQQCSHRSSPGPVRRTKGTVRSHHDSFAMAVLNQLLLS